MDGISAFSALEGLFTGNVNLVKLPGGGDPVAEWLISRLRLFRGALQTICILCPRTADDRLREQFFRAGAVRITSPGHMSLGYRGEPHDGEMSMRRYVKRVSAEIP